MGGSVGCGILPPFSPCVNIHCKLLHIIDHRVHIFIRDETGLVSLPTQLERTLQLYW